MESEEVNSKPIENNEEEEIEEEQENEEGQENEKEGNENNSNLLVKEEKVEKNEPVQEIKMAEDKPEEKEEEEEKEGKEEEEIEVEEEVEAENEAQNEGENEGEIELKIKKSDEDDEEHLEENNIKEDKESPIEESGNRDNQEAFKGSEENADEEHEQSEEEKEGILKIENADAKKSTQEYNFNGTQILATYYEDKDNMNIVFKKSSSSPNLILHWGLIKEYPANEWHHPNKENYPRYTKEFDEFALQTEFDGDGKESTIELELPKNDDKGISFVFYNPDNQEWYNNNWRDFQIFFSN